MFANPDGYEQFMGRWSRLIAPTLLEFANVTDGWRILDLGSGTGSLSIAIAARLPHCQVVGLDPSRDYVTYAQDRVHDRNVQFHVGTAEKLPFGDAQFDTCLSLLIFNVLPDPLGALRELRRVTRSGGRICAATWDYGNGMQMLRLFWDAAVALDSDAQSVDERHMPLCQAGALSALWNEGGLTDIQEQPIKIAMHFISFAEFWEPFLAGQGPAGAYVKRLTSEHQLDLRDRLMRLLPKGARQGAFELSASAWAVQGTVQ